MAAPVVTPEEIARLTARHREAMAMWGWDRLTRLLEIAESLPALLSSLTEAREEIERLTEEADVRAAMVEYDLDPVEMLKDVGAEALAKALIERDALREALADCRAAIFSDLNTESIVCTVWHREAETLADYIDGVLSPPDEKTTP